MYWVSFYFKAFWKFSTKILFRLLKGEICKPTVYHSTSLWQYKYNLKKKSDPVCIVSAFFVKNEIKLTRKL